MQKLGLLYPAGELGFDAEPCVAQPSRHSCESTAARLALAGERRLERLVVRVHADPHHVKLAVGKVESARDRVDLDAGQELQREGTPAGSA